MSKVSGIENSSDRDTPVSSVDKRTASRRRGAARVMIVAAVAALTMLTAGYFVFLGNVQTLAQKATPMQADGIIVLTGGHKRLEVASSLLQSGKGQRLLVSGVNTDTAPEDLRAALTIDAPLFECCVDIDYGALDTIGNAMQGSEWIDQHGYDTVLVVTNDYHMPRSLLEMGRANSQTRLLAHSVKNPPQPGETLATKLDRHRVLSGEYLKYVLSLAHGVVPIGYSAQDHVSTASTQTGW